MIGAVACSVVAMIANNIWRWHCRFVSFEVFCVHQIFVCWINNVHFLFLTFGAGQVKNDIVDQRTRSTPIQSKFNTEPYHIENTTHFYSSIENNTNLPAVTVSTPNIKCICLCAVFHQKEYNTNIETIEPLNTNNTYLRFIFLKLCFFSVLTFCCILANQFLTFASTYVSSLQAFESTYVERTLCKLRTYV